MIKVFSEKQLKKLINPSFLSILNDKKVLICKNVIT
jgi:hypothetical protein